MTNSEEFIGQVEKRKKNPVSNVFFRDRMTIDVTQIVKSKTSSAVMNFNLISVEMKFETHSFECDDDVIVDLCHT